MIKHRVFEKVFGLDFHLLIINEFATRSHHSLKKDNHFSNIYGRPINFQEIHCKLYPLFDEEWRCNFATCAVCNCMLTSKWRHNGRDSVSNHQPHDCLLNGLFRRRSKKTSKLRVTGLWVPGTGGFPAQTVSNSENVSIWWRYHVRFHGFTWAIKTNFRITANINHSTGKEPFFKDLAKIRYMNHAQCMIACYK